MKNNLKSFNFEEYQRNIENAYGPFGRNTLMDVITFGYNRNSKPPERKVLNQEEQRELELSSKSRLYYDFQQMHNTRSFWNRVKKNKEIKKV